MIAEIVLFELPRGATRAHALALYRTSAAQWAANPDLVEKYYFFDEARGEGGGVYIWRTREAAERWHGDEYKSRVRALYGSPPRTQAFEALIRVDAVAGVVTEL